MVITTMHLCLELVNLDGVSVSAWTVILEVWTCFRLECHTSG